MSQDKQKLEKIAAIIDRRIYSQYLEDRLDDVIEKLEEIQVIINE